MEAYDILLTIESRPGKENYLMTIKSQDEKHTGKLFLPEWVLDHKQTPSGIDLGSYIFQSIKDIGMWPRLLEWIMNAEKAYYYYPAFFIQLKAEELYRLRWEDIKQFHEFFPLNKVVVMRYLPEASAIVNLPLQLPVDVLIGSDSSKETLGKLPTNDTQRYFRSTKSIMLNADKLRGLLDQFEYNIVHLTGTAEWVSNASVFRAGSGAGSLEPGEFLSLLKKSKTRLVILHGIDDSYEAILDFAHRIFDKDGPTILTIFEKDKIYEPNFTIDNLYYDIVHDVPIDLIFTRIPLSYQPSLLLAAGGADVLRISQLASGIFLRQEQQFRDAKNVYSLLNQKLAGGYIKPAMEESVKKDIGHLKLFIDEFERTGGTKQQFLDYTRESGAMVPMTDMEVISSFIDEKLAANEPLVKRVVNCWFRDGNKIIAQNEKLGKNKAYSYQVQIGMASLNSIIKNAVAFPDEDLKPFYSGGEIPLRVVLFSNDFKFLSSSSKELSLPLPPNESDPVVFDLMTPGTDKLVRMRVGIYFRNNLVQTLLVRAIVGDAETTDKTLTGNTAEVDFSLTSSFANFEDLQNRELNIAMNESDSGTHSFYIAGEDVERQFDFGEGFISTSIKNMRNALQNICSTQDKQGKIKEYRFKNDNTGNEKDFVTEIKKLAEFGYKLYWEILTDQDKEFEKKLSKILQKPRVPIQVSLTRSAKYIFPWALVYDKPLLYGNYDVCPQFLNDIKNMGTEDFINNQTCINHGCPHQADNSIVCPSGFWGIKHIIEQPLSVLTGKPGEKKITTTINAQKNISNIMMGVSLKLDNVNKHLAEIQSLSPVQVLFVNNKLQIGAVMKQNNSPVLYFYCHGGRNEANTWIGVGDEDKIVPTDLQTWGIDWPVEHPFVFINGCHTVGVTPDDFINFNKTFARCEAAGVMGTEIVIPETLAGYFAKDFLQSFLSGKKVGEIMRRQRMQMLKNYNLLGLAYTPYCSADLELIFT